ncbi:ABC-three component system middle component 6 [Salinicoccus roseus]|uniref:ABC-three component system middle component 6 n=1 Tax=Salinicoccus roseus TaxID=45670 RepID=UPI0023005310|nr:ABC-three component system middle component 6 [Salinicoccus roseus]
MILPDKYVVLTESFLGLSALILDTLNNKKMPIDKLWNAFEKKYIKTKKIKNPPSYQKYIYAIEFMYLTNMVSYNEKGEILNENKGTQNTK